MQDTSFLDLVRPERLEVQPDEGAHRASFVVEPLERGYGLTLGNALRRVLLASVVGDAVCAVQIDGVLHEFTAIPGVSEDTTDIIMNVKELAIRKSSGGDRRVTVRMQGPGPVKAALLAETADITVFNPDHVLCHLDRGVNFAMTLFVRSGRGYVSADRNRSDDQPVGVIPVDAIYSPVKRVSYTVEKSRFGQALDYDRLILTVETNGAVMPDEAVANAARILRDQLKVFAGSVEEVVQVRAEVHADLPFDPVLLKRVDELELSVRSANCLKNDNILYIGDLIRKSEGDMLRTPNFGRKSLNEIKEVLTAMGLQMGVDVPNWPPENIEELAKRYEDKF